MRLSLTSLLRTLMWVAIGISLVAIGLGRSATRTLPVRHAAVPRYQGVNGRIYPVMDYRPSFLDRETGRTFQIESPEGETLEYSVCSPWRDERGQFQAVSRWATRAGQDHNNLPQAFGLARYTLPEGQLIDRVKLDLVPLGEPCWVPGLEPRILFVAGDGAIYHYAFEDADGGPPGRAREPSRPRRLTWRTDPPGIGLHYVKDLVWPNEPKLGGRLIASLCYLVEVDGVRKFVGTELWWLQLSGDGMAIEAAGRLTPDPEDRGGLAEVEERLPNVASTPGGEPTLAYLAREEGDALWELRVAPIVIDPRTGTPSVRRGSSRGLSRDCLTTAPTFSTDGRWVYGIIGPATGFDSVAPRRFSVEVALAQAEAIPGPSEPRSQHPGPEGPPRLVRADRAGFPPTRLVHGRTRRHAR